MVDWGRYGAFEIPGLDFGGGSGQPPGRIEGLGDADYLRELIRHYTTPRRRQSTSFFDGGMHFGPAREATVSPGDMDTAAGLMDLLAAMNAERDMEERRELAMRVLKAPAGDKDNWIEWKGGERRAAGPLERARGGRPAPPSRGEMAPSHGGPGPQRSEPRRVEGQFGTGEQPLSRRDAIALGAEPQTRQQEENARALAESRGMYYGARADASGRPNAALIEEVQILQEDVRDIRRRLTSESVTDMERRELEIELADKLAILARAGFTENDAVGVGAGGGGEVYDYDEFGNRIPRR